MGATSRVLAALTLSAGLLLPATAAMGLPSEDPAPAASAQASADVPIPTGAPVANSSIAVPDFGTASWLLADLDTGEILAARNAEAPVRPASTLKLLTALTVAPRLAPEQPYRAVKADEEAEGNRVVLYRGLQYKVADLLHAALLPSANDAAEALARANGGMDVTVDQMNAEAARLGATSTTAKNPSGLDADGQLTTALDMALIGRAAFANPEIADYLKLRVVDFPGKSEAGKRVIYPIYNHNRMLAHPNFVGPLGGKSGYTSKAGRTLVAAADRDGRRLLVTLFHIGGNTYRTGEQLLDWGYANIDSLAPMGTLPTPNAPSPSFDRAIMALPEVGTAPVSRTVEQADVPAADAPTASRGASTFGLPGLPSPLTVLTLMTAVVVALRARVYWIAHRNRTSWIELDSWARRQARSSARRGPADRRVRPARPDHAHDPDEGLIGARR